MGHTAVISVTLAHDADVETRHLLSPHFWLPVHIPSVRMLRCDRGNRRVSSECLHGRGEGASLEVA